MDLFEYFSQTNFNQQNNPSVLSKLGFNFNLFQRQKKIFYISGACGKTSTSVMLAQILIAAGYGVDLITFNRNIPNYKQALFAGEVRTKQWWLDKLLELNKFELTVQEMFFTATLLEMEDSSAEICIIEEERSNKAFIFNNVYMSIITCADKNNTLSHVAAIDAVKKDGLVLLGQNTNQQFAKEIKLLGKNPKTITMEIEDELCNLQTEMMPYNHANACLAIGAILHSDLNDVTTKHIKLGIDTSLKQLKPKSNFALPQLPRFSEVMVEGARSTPGIQALADLLKYKIKIETSPKKVYLVVTQSNLNIKPIESAIKNHLAGIFLNISVNEALKTISTHAKTPSRIVIFPCFYSLE